MMATLDDLAQQRNARRMSAQNNPFVGRAEAATPPSNMPFGNDPNAVPRAQSYMRTITPTVPPPDPRIGLREAARRQGYGYDPRQGANMFPEWFGPAMHAAAFGEGPENAEDLQRYPQKVQDFIKAATSEKTERNIKAASWVFPLLELLGGEYFMPLAAGSEAIEGLRKGHSVLKSFGISEPEAARPQFGPEQPRTAMYPWSVQGRSPESYIRERREREASRRLAESGD